jgi:GrpE protein
LKGDFIVFGINSVNKEKKVDSERSCPESKNTNHQGISGKEVTVDKETILAVVEVIYQFFTAMNTRLVRQDKKVSKALEGGKKDLATLEKCFDTLADCQRQTADFANHALQRHVLYPSILAVDLLSSTICQMAQQANALKNSQQPNTQMMSLVESILSAAEIAESKKASLDIQSIQPAEMDELDKDMHQIINAVDTDDESRHKKIHQTLTAGLMYRGKVLREAKVSVYRFSGKVAE